MARYKTEVVITVPVTCEYTMAGEGLALMRVEIPGNYALPVQVEAMPAEARRRIYQTLVDEIRVYERERQDAFNDLEPLK